MQNQSWSPAIALRDIVELVAVLAFVVVVPPLIEQVWIHYGLSITGTSRLVATGSIFVLWAGFTATLLLLNREPLSNVGLTSLQHPLKTVTYGLLTAAAIFAVVVTLETLGFGRDRLGEMAEELKGSFGLLLARMAFSILVVGFVEEFVFRGFIMSRVAALLGGSRPAWALALIVQAALFGLSHGYQQLYGVVLTGAIGLFLGGVYLTTGRNLWIVIIGHGFYNAAHAALIGMMMR
jgi:membrane protease YdiL (CAAX protease family)